MSDSKDLFGDGTEAQESGSPREGGRVLPEYRRLLTQDEMKRATAWINEKSKAVEDACIVCGSTNNTVQPSFAPMPGGASPFRGAAPWVYPSVVTVCFDCGFMRHFNAVVMGLVKPDGGDDGQDV